MDLLAANRLARAFYCDVYADSRRPPNIARFTFLDPAGERFYPDWDSAADICVAILRTEAGRNPHDRQLHDLVGELSTRSDDFRTRWGSHDVRHHGTGTKRFHHPVVGELTLAYEGLEMAAEPGLTLTIYTAEPGSASAERLQLLGSWAATQRRPSTHAAAVRDVSDRRRLMATRPRHRIDHRARPRRSPQTARRRPPTSSSTPATDERAERTSSRSCDDRRRRRDRRPRRPRRHPDRWPTSVNALGDVDAVIHNAGIYTDAERNRTVDGHPRVFAVNVLAPYLLTALDPPTRPTHLPEQRHAHLRTSLPSTTSTGTDRRWNGTQAYCDSKLLVTTLAAAVARHWPDVHSNAVDPGWVPTRMGGPHATDDLALGHDTQVWLATSDEPAASHDRQVLVPPPGLQHPQQP